MECRVSVSELSVTHPKDVQYFRPIHSHTHHEADQMNPWFLQSRTPKGRFICFKFISFFTKNPLKGPSDQSRMDHALDGPWFININRHMFYILNFDLEFLKWVPSFKPLNTQIFLIP